MFAMSFIPSPLGVKTGGDMSSVCRVVWRAESKSTLRGCLAPSGSMLPGSTGWAMAEGRALSVMWPVKAVPKRKMRAQNSTSRSSSVSCRSIRGKAISNWFSSRYKRLNSSGSPPRRTPSTSNNWPGVSTTKRSKPCAAETMVGLSV